MNAQAPEPRAGRQPRLLEKPRASGGHRRRRRRRQRSISPDQGRLDGCAADRARRIDLGFDLARCRRHAHRQRRSQCRQAAAIHHRAVPGNRAHFRPVLRRPHHRRHHAGRYSRAPRLAEDGQGARPLSRHGSGDHLGRRGGEAVSAAGEEAFHGRDVRPDRRPRRSRTASPTPMRNPRSSAAPRSCAIPASSDLEAARRRHLGCDHRSRQRACRACGERRRVCGRAKWAAWSASNCRCWRWSTST